MPASALYQKIENENIDKNYLYPYLYLVYN